MKKLRRFETFSRTLAVLFSMALLGLAINAKAASVGPAGYTNGFGSQPPAADWATFGRTGAQADSYNMDTDVNANLTASGITAQTAFSSVDPPAAGGTAN